MGLLSFGAWCGAWVGATYVAVQGGFVPALAMWQWGVLALLATILYWKIQVHRRFLLYKLIIYVRAPHLLLCPFLNTTPTG